MWLSHQAVNSLFYSYSLEWRQHFEKHTILAYVYHLNNTMTVNEPKLSFIWFIYLESIAWRLVVSDLNFKARLRFYGNLVGARSKTLQVPRKKKKTVTFNDSILGIYGSNVNDFKALPHAFPSRWFNPTFACPWRAENVPFPGRKMNRIDFLTVATNFRFLFDFYWHSLLMITQFFGKIINDGFF